MRSVKELYALVDKNLHIMQGLDRMDSTYIELKKELDDLYSEISRTQMHWDRLRLNGLYLPES